MQSGIALKPMHDAKWKEYWESFKFWYLRKVKGFDPLEQCMASLYFIGSKETVEK